MCHLSLTGKDVKFLLHKKMRESGKSDKSGAATLRCGQTRAPAREDSRGCRAHNPRSE
ncbi:hypothetical protein THIOKS12860042 [Thiocapsa sp. KS1]|nr:hypothetical protein THIOKS12860042 [Thiocapsa sp. KS1]